MRNSNPALSDKVFSRSHSQSVMTLSGAVNKCLVLLFLVIVSAAATWNYLYATDALGKAVGFPKWYYGAIVLTLILSLRHISEPTRPY